MMKTKFSIGAKSTKYGQSPVRTAAKTPVDIVAKLTSSIPHIMCQKFIIYNSNADNHALKIMKKEKEV